MLSICGCQESTGLLYLHQYLPLLFANPNTCQETTWWGQDGRLQTKRERQWHADSKWCAHRGSSAPGAAAESEQSIPSLELMAGEHVVEVEQFIVPANRADRTKQVRCGLILRSRTLSRGCTIYLFAREASSQAKDMRSSFT